MNLWRFIGAGLKLLFRRPILGVTLIPLLDDGRILLAKRRDTNQWSLPGEIIDWGEDVATCARRELLEETGFQLTKISRLVGVYSSSERDPRFHSVTVAIAVEAKALTGEIEDADEIIEIQPFEINDIPLENLSHDHAQILKDYLDGKTVVA